MAKKRVLSAIRGFILLGVLLSLLLSPLACGGGSPNGPVLVKDKNKDKDKNTDKKTSQVIRRELIPGDVGDPANPWLSLGLG